MKFSQINKNVTEKVLPSYTKKKSSFSTSRYIYFLPPFKRQLTPRAAHTLILTRPFRNKKN